MLTVCAFILLSSFSLAVVGEYKFKAEHCAGEKGANKALQLFDVKLKSDPIQVPGVIEASIKFYVTNAPVEGKTYQLKFELWRKLFSESMIDVPCDEDLGFGSCTYDFCDVLANKSRELPGNEDCKILPCSCDKLKTGLYTIPSFKYEIKQEQLDKLFLPSLIYGDYKADVKLVRTDPEETEACVHLEFTIANKDCTGLFCG